MFCRSKMISQLISNSFRITVSFPLYHNQAIPKILYQDNIEMVTKENTKNACQSLTSDQTNQQHV
jgi:hypothetical protein